VEILDSGYSMLEVRSFGYAQDEGSYCVVCIAYCAD